MQCLEAGCLGLAGPLGSAAGRRRCGRCGQLRGHARAYVSSFEAGAALLCMHRGWEQPLMPQHSCGLQPSAEQSCCAAAAPLRAGRAPRRDCGAAPWRSDCLPLNLRCVERLWWLCGTDALPGGRWLGLAGPLGSAAGRRRCGQRWGHARAYVSRFQAPGWLVQHCCACTEAKGSHPQPDLTQNTWWVQPTAEQCVRCRRRPAARRSGTAARLRGDLAGWPCT